MKSYEKVVLISFDHLQKIHFCAKLEGRGSTVEPARPILSLNFKWAWRTRLRRHTHQILKNCVFLKAKVMILLSIFDISIQKSAILEKLIFCFKSRPQPGKFSHVAA